MGRGKFPSSIGPLGPFVPPLRYSPYGPMMMDTQQQPNGDDSKFQPSKSLCQHIMERLQDQSDALNAALEHVDNLIGLSEYGEAQSSQKRPGDEHIPASKVRLLGSSIWRSGQSIREQALHNEEGPCCDPYGLLERRISLRSMGAFPRPPHLGSAWSPWANAKDPNGEDIKVFEENHPMIKYKRAEAEIHRLLEMSTVRSQKHAKSPIQAMADRYSAMAEPQKEYDRRLEEILGPGDGGVEEGMYGARKQPQRLPPGQDPHPFQQQAQDPSMYGQRAMQQLTPGPAGSDA